MQTLDDLDVHGRRVLLRADLNVPLSGPHIADDSRIRATLPTMATLMERGARVVVCAHLGRPGGVPDFRYSLAPVAIRLGRLLGSSVRLCADAAGPAARKTVAALAPGDVAMLENLRFSAGETSADAAERGRFADRLAGLADMYVGDGFGVLHRRHASVCETALRLPRAAGYLVAAETAALGRLAGPVARPFALVLGGAAAADKLEVVAALLKRLDRVLVGGAMALPFLAAQGLATESAAADPGLIAAARHCLDQAGRAGVTVTLPGGPGRGGTPGAGRAMPGGRDGRHPGGLGGPGHRAGDGPAVRPAPRRRGHRVLEWPDGHVRAGPFAHGTAAVARVLAGSRAFTVVGGGDTTAAVRALGFPESAFGHLSTGGGASLEYLEGRTLPGLAALRVPPPGSPAGDRCGDDRLTGDPGRTGPSALIRPIPGRRA